MSQEIKVLLELIEKRASAPPLFVPCKLCGKETPNGNVYCHFCVWKTRWAWHILTAPENERRRKRSHLTKLLVMDPQEPLAIFKGSGKALYITHLKSCSCVDFGLGHGKRPCKHIYRLAEELGLFQAETFKSEEDDYIMHIHEDNFDVRKYFQGLAKQCGNDYEAKLQALSMLALSEKER